jgi:hypothetical protein
LVDAQDNILALEVATAEVQDRDGAQLLLKVLAVACGWPKLIGADDIKSFKVLRKRGIVVRTFGWLIQSRWLVRSYQEKTEPPESMIYPSMSMQMLSRVAN